MIDIAAEAREIAELVRAPYPGDPGADIDAIAAVIAALATRVRAERADWRGMDSAPKSGCVLLLVGETIPDTPHVLVGSFVSASDSVELGYDEFDERGAWMIWNSDGDFYCIVGDAPTHWMPLPPPPETEDGK